MEELKTRARMALAVAAAILIAMAGARHTSASDNSAPPSYVFFNHLHSKVSKDNASLRFLKMTPRKIYELALKHARLRGDLGMIAITDHNDDHGYDSISSFSKLSTELTHTRAAEWGRRTHMNLLGLSPEWPLLSRFKEFSFLPQLEAARDVATVRVINHPSYKKLEWPEDQWGDAEAVEVWNSPLDHHPLKFLKRFNKARNSQAMDEWLKALASGRRYTGLAGSDAHFKVPGYTERVYFYPSNRVYAQSQSPESMLGAIRAGRVSMTLTPEAPAIFLQLTDPSGRVTEMGGTEPGTSPKLLVEAWITPSPLRKSTQEQIEVRAYRLVPARKAWKTETARIKGDKPVRLAWDLDTQAGTRDLVRIEVWQKARDRGPLELVGISNPVYISF